LEEYLQFIPFKTPCYCCSLSHFSVDDVFADLEDLDLALVEDNNGWKLFRREWNGLDMTIVD